ncbi:MAG: Ig-like domain-containing protein, partial [Oscillospiraceae bacterium]
MKKFRHILSLLLVVTALTGLMTVGASAASDDQLLEAKALSAMGLFMGYDNTGNNFGLDNTLTREQALALLIRMKGEAAAAEAWTGPLPYTDVSTGNKLLPYIGYGKEMGYTKGVGNGNFGVGRTAGMQEMTVFALRGLGYSDSKTVGDFDWNSALSAAKSVGVLDSTKVIKPFTRGHVVDILTNTLASNVKGQNYDLLSNLMNNNVVSQAQYDKALEIINGTPQVKYDIAAGTYTLKCLGNNLRVTSDKMELRNTSPAQTFTITNQDGCSYIKTADGYYVGITSLAKGTQLVLGTTPYSWLIKKQSGSTYTIRSAEKTDLVVNACEEKSANGTKIIVWPHSGAPKNALITFTAAGKTTAVTGVQLDQTTVKVTVGKTVQLTGSTVPANATNQKVTWSSSASSVAKVDSNGVVTGVKAGTATITVKTVDGGKTATCKVTVTAATDKLIKSAVTLRNQTGKSITELYITDSSLSSYDAEFLKESGYSSFSHNKTITRTFEFYADTKFDILIRFADGSEAEALGLSFAKGTTSPCDLTLGTKEAILARNGVTLARVSFENKANDLDAKSKAVTDRYNKAIARYNTLIAECEKLGLDKDPAFVKDMNAIITEVNKMGKIIGEGIGVLTDAQIKEFTANLNELDAFMTQMETLIKNTSAKP